MDDQLKQYLEKTLPPPDSWVTELEKQAKQENIPIMDPIGINFLMQLIRINQPKKILEIGTAIGYSALRMLEANPESSIVTIERDERRYDQAIANVKKLDKQHKIQVIFGDALEKISELQPENAFDLIFIDAAKGQYKRFFELTCPFLSKSGIIVSDNVLFKGYVADSNLTDKKRLQEIARKIRTYNDWLVQHPDYITSIVPIGDGVAISKKRNN